MNKVREWLSGKKTYITGIITVLGCLVAWIEGGDLNWNLIITAIMGMFIRAGVAKNG